MRAILRQEIDWAYLFQAARSHGMTSLLYWHLNAACQDQIPPPILSQFREHFDSNTRRNLFFSGELLKLLNLLDRHGVSAIPFKGPTLAALAYGHVGFREFSDLDILIHRKDLPRTQALLVSQGYRPQFELDPTWETAFLRCENALLFERAAGAVMVELHWELTPMYLSFRPDFDHLWERREPASPGGKEVMTLALDDLLLFLCVHGAKHLWGSLGWICDIAKLISLPKGIDWVRVIKRAGEQGIERMLWLGLYLACDLLEADVPVEVRQRMQADPIVRALASKIHEWYLGDSGREVGIFGHCLFNLKLRERSRDKVNYCLHMALTPSVKDWDAFRLPTSFSWLYPFLRPLRLIREYRLISRAVK